LDCGREAHVDALDFREPSQRMSAGLRGTTGGADLG
jgi:hypothetical protein